MTLCPINGLIECRVSIGGIRLHQTNDLQPFFSSHRDGWYPVLPLGAASPAG